MPTSTHRRQVHMEPQHTHTASAAREPLDHSTILFENALTGSVVVGNAIYTSGFVTLLESSSTI